MDERKKSKRKVRKEEKQNLGSKSLQIVGIYQRMYRLSHYAFILTLRVARKSPAPWSRVLFEDLILPQIRNIPNFMEPDGHYNVPNSPPFGPILSHISGVHGHSVYYFRTHFNIILQSTPTSSKWFFPVSCPYQNISLRVSACQTLGT
jgi:hypothetical protein